jgi:hypothetical protein
MLNGWEKDIALMCIKSLENHLESYQKTTFPFSYGMKGLSELNEKDMIEYKIKSIKHIINKPEENSLGDIEPYCEDMIDITSLEKKMSKTERKDTLTTSIKNTKFKKNIESKKGVPRNAVSRNAVSRNAVSRNAVSRNAVSRNAVSRNVAPKNEISRSTKIVFIALQRCELLI